MQHTLKLTITAVGENDSVFLTPCEPVTLHESCVEDPDAEAAPSDVDTLPAQASADHGLAPSGDDDVMVMLDA